MVVGVVVVGVGVDDDRGMVDADAGADVDADVDAGADEEIGEFCGEITDIVGYASEMCKVVSNESIKHPRASMSSCYCVII